MRFVYAGAIAAAIGAGCGGDSRPAVDTPAECNPLGGVGCVTPWPSSIYQVADATTPTGVRLDIPAGALPINSDGIPVDPTRYNEHDGFSPAGFAFTVFAGGVEPRNLVSHGDFDASLTDASPTVLIDVATGERLHHFAEVDVNATEFDLDQQALYVRPAGRLAPGRRYAVAVRRSLRALDGSELERPAGFAALVDGRPTQHARLEAIRGDFEAVLAALETAGVPRDDLVVAWEFTTASDDYLTSTLLQGRDAALAAMGERGANLTYEVDSDAPVGDGALIARRIAGTFTAPQLVVDPADSLTELARDATGAPEVHGVMEMPLVIQVPACAAAQKPVPMVLFGHGFFGDTQEVQGEYMRRLAAEACVVTIATEWYGMSRSDLTGAALALNEASRLIGFGERIAQGILNLIALEQLSRGAIAAELLQLEGEPLVDIDRLYFYGISQGHILGTTFLAYDPFIERGAFAVGGTNWSMLFERSTNWPTFQIIINGAYEGPLNTIIIESLMQLAFDPIENMHISHRLLHDPLPGTSAKQVVLHMAVGDSQVSNLATEQQARVMDLPVLTPSVREPWGLATTQAPADSALVIFDEHPEPLPPTTNERHSANNDTHGSQRTRNASIEQLSHFFAAGEIIDTCDGACDCATGACD